MDDLLHLVNAWKDLVVKLFSDYPLAGAISIAAGYAAWRYAEKVRNPGKPVISATMALLGPAYFAWAHWRPHVMPNRWLRIVSLALGVVVLAYLLAPLIGRVTGEPVPLAISQ
jgi:hypothetical protein